MVILALALSYTGAGSQTDNTSSRMSPASDVCMQTAALIFEVDL